MVLRSKFCLHLAANVRADDISGAEIVEASLTFLRRCCPWIRRTGVYAVLPRRLLSSVRSSHLCHPPGGRRTRGANVLDGKMLPLRAFPVMTRLSSLQNVRRVACLRGERRYRGLAQPYTDLRLRYLLATHRGQGYFWCEYIGLVACLLPAAACLEQRSCLEDLASTHSDTASWHFPFAARFKISCPALDMRTGAMCHASLLKSLSAPSDRHGAFISTDTNSFGPAQRPVESALSLLFTGDPRTNAGLPLHVVQFHFVASSRCDTFCRQRPRSGAHGSR